MTAEEEFKNRVNLKIAEISPPPLPKPLPPPPPPPKLAPPPPPPQQQPERSSPPSPPPPSPQVSVERKQRDLISHEPTFKLESSRERARVLAFPLC